MNYFKQLISARSDTSHKRFISITSLFVFFIVVGFALAGIKVEPEIIYALVTLITASSVMTLVSTSNKTTGSGGVDNSGSKRTDDFNEGEVNNNNEGLAG